MGQELIAYLAVLAMVGLGFYIMFAGFRGASLRKKWGLTGPTSKYQPGLKSKAVREGVNAIVTTAIVYRLFIHSYLAGTIEPWLVMGGIFFVILCLAVIPDLQVLVGIAALAIFLIENYAQLYGLVGLLFWLSTLVLYIVVYRILHK